MNFCFLRGEDAVIGAILVDSSVPLRFNYVVAATLSRLKPYICEAIV